MHDRSALGPADVPDHVLAGMVADLLGVEEAAVVESSAAEVDYDLPAITTAGRWWVSGRARTPAGARDFRFFVKHVQSWARSPMFEQVPPELRELAEAGVPWRTEALVYRSDLGSRLPAGLRMPRALAVHDLDERSAAIWLETVPAVDRPWDVGRFGRAAHLLGRMSASPEVAPLADVGGHPFTVRDYFEGRFTYQVLPMLRADDLWRHPLLAPFGDGLREQMLAAAERMPAYVDELAAAPRLPAHGDACPNNLLATAADRSGFVMVDFGFWGRLPLGFDLGQLLVGEVQLGRIPASSLAAIDGAIVPAYVEGLRAEGASVPEATVRRVHALQLLLFTALSTLPFEHLDAPPSEQLLALAADRAAITRFGLDLVAATGG